MWTPTTREQHSRPAARCQTDLTEAEWRLIEPRLPPARKTGRSPRLVDARDRQRDLLLAARRDRLAAPAIGFSALADHLPLVRRLSRRLRVRENQSRPGHGRSADHERVGRDASPTAATIDSQSVMPSSTLTGERCSSNRIPPTFGIGTAAGLCFRCCAPCFRSSSSSGSMADTITSG